MATGMFYLRPSSTISNTYNTSNSNYEAHALINEEVKDDVGYILASRGKNDTTNTAVFSLGGITPSNEVVDVKLYVYEYTTAGTYITTQYIIEVNGVTQDTITSSAGLSSSLSSSLLSYDCPNTSSAIRSYVNSNGSFPSIRLTMKSAITGYGDSKTVGYHYIYQAYLELSTYNGAHRKLNDAWIPSVAAYQRVNDTWNRLPAANLNSILRSRLYKAGHMQVAIDGSYDPTCTETGLFAGYKCSICGKILEEEKVIPSTGHSPVTIAGYAATCGLSGLTNGQKCTVCNSTLIAQEVIPATGNHAYVTSNIQEHTICTTCGYIQNFGFANLVYQGTATAMSADKGGNGAATTIGDYALFAGGRKSTSTVDVYNKSLTHSTMSNLSYESSSSGYNYKRSHLAATTVGNYALFGGGNGNTEVSYVDAYNSSLTHSNASNLNVSRDELAATTVGNYALFGGGYSNGSSRVNTVDAYNNSLTHTATSLSDSCDELAATTVGSYAVFAGYYVSNAFNQSLTRTSITSLSSSRNNLAATTVGNYALFGGGSNESTVDAYNQSLTRVSAPSFNSAKDYNGATTLGNYAIFGAQQDTSIADIYNQSLTHTTLGSSGSQDYLTSATTIGNYALFGGGGGSTNMDVYTLQAK